MGLILNRRFRFLGISFLFILALVVLIATKSHNLSKSSNAVDNIVPESKLKNDPLHNDKLDAKLLDEFKDSQNKDDENSLNFEIDDSPDDTDINNIDHSSINDDTKDTNSVDEKNTDDSFHNDENTNKDSASSNSEAKSEEKSEDKSEDNSVGHELDSVVVDSETDPLSIHPEEHIEDLPPPVEEEKLESDPEAPEDSSYAQNENDEENIDEEKVNEQLNEYLEDSNPPDLEKDWSIKLNNDILSLDVDDFKKGDKLVKDFFSQILQLIHGNRLSYPLKQRMNMENGKTIIDPIIFYSNAGDTLSESDCMNFFKFPDQFVNDVTIKHKIITDNLPDLTPTFYGGSGYVIVGGGKYSWFSILVIETLRKLHSTLPVEVFIPTPEDYEEHFCERILPQYNARCIQITDIFNDDILKKITINGYQYKSLALLASSFKHAFLLDSDTYPVINPDPLFESEIYSTYTMITWPDYWRRTTSPLFYKIRGTKIGKRIRHLNDIETDLKYIKVENEDEDDEILKTKVPLHDREGTLTDWTTESGEMLINKKIHFKALLLALYYNLDGQFGYYPLLSQGGAGEGDKETFVAASNYYDLNYYQVFKMPDRAYGYHKFRTDELVDTSIIQYSPLKDYDNLLKFRKAIKTAISSKGENFDYNYDHYYTDKFQIDNSIPMFYHVHETKMDPFHLSESEATFDLKGNKIRNLGGDFPRIDFDLEKFLWNTINKHLCVQENKFDYFKSKDMLTLCTKFIPKELDFLNDSTYKLLKMYIEGTPFDNLRRLN